MKSKTIILSIHPRHVEKILSGEKRYEYRKQIPTDIQYVIIYATAPIKKIVALVNIDTILMDTPQNIWEQTKSGAGISQDFYTDYFKNKTVAYAIKFCKIHQLPNPVDYTVINGVKCAPQAYMYVNESIADLCKKLSIILSK